MSRSLKKEPFIDPNLLKKVAQFRDGKIKEIKIWSRDSIIYPDLVGLTILVHNGRKHLPVNINENMVGHRLGEFSPTRTFHRHGGKMAKEQAAGSAKK